MTNRWDEFTTVELRSVATALAAGRLGARPGALALERFCVSGHAAGLATLLGAMGGEPTSIAALLEALADERERVATARRATELVWSGPEIPNDSARDTGAVVRELFAFARERVLVAGYAVHGGRDLFALLADRCEQVPELRVELILDIRRERGDTSLASDIVSRFAHEFGASQWPHGKRLPAVYHDPRSLALDPRERSAMHAKCIVVDRQVAFITSANFTHAAQQKNVEVGVLVRDATVATSVAGRFEWLIASGELRELRIG